MEEQVKLEATILTPQINPQTGSILEEKIAIPYTTTEPTFTPDKNGVRRVYYDGSSYWLYIYANGGWRKTSLGGSVAARGTAPNGQSISASSEVKVQIANSLSSGITFDSGNYRYTIVTAGNYLISGRVTMESPEDGKAYQTQIYKNNSPVFTGYAHTSSATVVSSSATGIITLSVGDYIELFTWHNSSGAKNTFSVNGSSELNINKI